MRFVMMLPLFFVLGLAAQDPLEYTEVVRADSTASASALFRKAERWFANTFNDANRVLQIRDSTQHLLVGNARSDVMMVMTKPAYYAAPWSLKFAMEVEAKPGRYRVRVFNIRIEDQPITDQECCTGTCATVGANRAEQRIIDNTRPGIISVCQQARQTVEGLIASLNAHMRSTEDSDW